MASQELLCVKALGLVGGHIEYARSLYRHTQPRPYHLQPQILSPVQEATLHTTLDHEHMSGYMS